MPQGSGTSEGQIAFAVPTLFGHWPYAVPLFELLAETGEEIIELMQVCQQQQ